MKISELTVDELNAIAVHDQKWLLQNIPYLRRKPPVVPERILKLIHQIKRCPCGKRPTRIDTQGVGKLDKYAFAVPDCCAEWMIEFRTVNFSLESNATQEAALKAWNRAPRGEEPLLLKEE